MNKEQQELLNEAYENYWNSHPDAEKTFQYEGHNIETRRMSKDEFVDMVKTDKEYGRRWGLKIEERELSTKERVDIFNLKMIKEGIRTQIATVGVVESYWKKSLEETRHNIPTKLITITYNDKTIESYE